MNLTEPPGRLAYELREANFRSPPAFTTRSSRRRPRVPMYVSGVMNMLSVKITHGLSRIRDMLSHTTRGPTHVRHLVPVIRMEIMTHTRLASKNATKLGLNPLA